MTMRKVSKLPGNGLVITNLIGGIGNQMFQYAAGRALAEKHGVPLLVDLRDFQTYELHQGYQLGEAFGLNLPVTERQALQQEVGLARLSLLLSDFFDEAICPGLGKAMCWRQDRNSVPIS